MSSPSCQTELLAVSSPSCQTGLLTEWSQLSDWTTGSEWSKLSDWTTDSKWSQLSDWMTGSEQSQLSDWTTDGEWSQLSDWTTDTEDESTTFFETLVTTLPLTQCHMSGDLNPNCTTVRTTNVTGSGLHLVVCCRVDQAGSTVRRDSHTVQHTACHTKLLQHILSTPSGSFTAFYCLAAKLPPPHTVPATPIHC